MKALTKEGEQYVAEIAAKYNLKKESVEGLMKAVIDGNGNMAQFNIQELGGQGQWMRGGMTMVGDMFNNSLRGTVDKVCNELSELVSTRVLYEAGSDQPEHTQKDSSGIFQGTGTSSWPAVFGTPTSSGAQNNLRYAYFAPVRRLVIEENGKRTIYDTRHHQITGVSQQQGTGSSHRFTSQDGPVDLSSLAVISEPGGQQQPTPEMAYDIAGTAELSSEPGASTPQEIVIATIEKVNMLYEKGQITEEEFKSKKQELLARL